MDKIQTPALRNGNPMCMEICLPIGGDHKSDVANRIQSWIDQVWMPNNREWVRVWRTGLNLEMTGETEILNYFDDFLRPPEIALKGVDNLIIILHVIQPSKNWKDWLALKIIHDIRACFPEVIDSKPRYIRRIANI